MVTIVEVHKLILDVCVSLIANLLGFTVHSTLCQSSFVHFLCYFANFSHFALFFSFSNGFSDNLVDSENLVRAPRLSHNQWSTKIMIHHGNSVTAAKN